MDGVSHEALPDYTNGLIDLIVPSRPPFQYILYAINFLK